MLGCTNNGYEVVGQNGQIHMSYFPHVVYQVKPPMYLIRERQTWRAEREYAPAT